MPITIKFKEGSKYEYLLEFKTVFETNRRKMQVTNIALVPDEENRSILSEVTVSINLYSKVQPCRRKAMNQQLELFKYKFSKIFRLHQAFIVLVFVLLILIGVVIRINTLSNIPIDQAYSIRNPLKLKLCNSMKALLKYRALNDSNVATPRTDQPEADKIHLMNRQTLLLHVAWYTSSCMNNAFSYHHYICTKTKQLGINIGRC